MEKNLEIEYKMLLTEEVFHQLMNDFTGHTYSQTNYYLTSIELGALRYSLRIREKEGYYEMTLKTPAANGRMEHNLEIGTLTVAEPLILKNVDYNVIFLSNF